MNAKVKQTAKDLCDKSPCHHKCHDTKDCVVEEEAKELFKQAINEGLTNKFDKILEKEKQIKEMAKKIENAIWKYVHEVPPTDVPTFVAEFLYNAGYRKQSEGEWGFDGMSWTCSECGEYALVDKHRNSVKSKYCPNCGAKMKGGAE